MFKLSTKVRYGLRFLITLAEKDKGQMVSIRDIATREHISNNYLRQIVMGFSKAGIIGSQRGKGGGVYLIKSPSDITLYDMYIALEENMTLIDCLSDFKKVCDPDFNMLECRARKVWRGLNDVMLKFLKETTLKDVLNG